MSLIPIKLLKNGLSKNTLLNLKGETHEIDTNDYIESRIKKETLSRKLLAIEDASEMAKLYLHKPGMFEKIGEDIKNETGKDFNFHCSKTKSMKIKKKKNIEYILMETSYSNGAGHYGMVKVNHKSKNAHFRDSMIKIDSDFKEPLNNALTKKYTVTQSNVTLQPTGGFVAASLDEFKKPSYSDGVPKKLLEMTFELSQYDELSQHHFCYVESFIAMMNDLGMGTSRDEISGPVDPRDRLTYVKRVVWGLIHKYVPKVKRKSAQWLYFVKNFPYIVDTRKSDGKRFRMVRGYIQVPPPSGEVVIKVKKLNLRDDINHTWSLKRILEWAS
tara:strand:+ start:86 stop:1072 length:987 start_codon:yes stop_codon:yes gene_type:complete